MADRLVWGPGNTQVSSAAVLETTVEEPACALGKWHCIWSYWRTHSRFLDTLGGVLNVPSGSAELVWEERWHWEELERWGCSGIAE